MPRDAHGRKIGWNGPCWCGSGEKFKRCHSRRSDEQAISRNEAIQDLRTSFEHEELLCPTDWRHQCAGKIIRAHSLSRSSALATITELGNVVSLIPDWPRRYHRGEIVLSEKSAKKASTFTGFCARHDNSIFRALDDTEFDGSHTLTFLSAYRTRCHEIFMKKGQINLAQHAKHMDRGQQPDNQVKIQGFSSELHLGANAALEELNELKGQYDSSIKSSDYGNFSFVNFHFAQQPNLLCAGGFNPAFDVSGTFLQKLDSATKTQNVFCSILPGKAGFWASFLWLREHSLMRAFLGDVEKNFGTAGGMYAIALSHIENTLVRPSFWDALSQSAKDNFQFLMMMDVSHRDYRKAKEVAAELTRNYSTPFDKVVRYRESALDK